MKHVLEIVTMTAIARDICVVHKGMLLIQIQWRIYQDADGAIALDLCKLERMTTVSIEYHAYGWIERKHR